MLHLLFALLQDGTPTQEPAPAGATSGAVASTAVDADAVRAALDAGVAVLLGTQERYQPDRGVGRLPDGELAGWQERERARLAEQRASGEPGVEWPYEGVYRVGRPALIPAGYRVGGTAIVCEALIAVPGYGDDEARRAAVVRATDFVLGMLDPQDGDAALAAGPKKGYDVRGWGHAQALIFLLEARERGLFDEARAARVDALLPHLVHCLTVNETRGGGWNYADGAVSPFMTATTLWALMDARDAGLAVDAELVERALVALERNRADNGAFEYSGPARGPVAMHASAARAAAAELVLLRAGRSDLERLHVAVLGFFDGWDELLARKGRQGTHEGDYAIAPYYFMYGHTWAARAIERLPEEHRAGLRARLLEVLWRTREADGSWNDRIFPRSSSYGTAMALLALVAE
jgi:hypothetical protein